MLKMTFQSCNSTVSIIIHNYSDIEVAFLGAYTLRPGNTQKWRIETEREKSW
jgi:hypothetical protein